MYCIVRLDMTDHLFASDEFTSMMCVGLVVTVSSMTK